RRRESHDSERQKRGAPNLLATRNESEQGFREKDALAKADGAEDEQTESHRCPAKARGARRIARSERLADERRRRGAEGETRCKSVLEDADEVRCCRSTNGFAATAIEKRRDGCDQEKARHHGHRGDGAWNREPKDFSHGRALDLPQ